MTTRVFVSGAAGFVGRQVCRHLVSQGYLVHVVIRRYDIYLNKIGVKVWIGDLWNGDVLESAMSGIDYVIHCAGDATFGNGAHYRRANLDLTAHLIDKVKNIAPDIRRFTFVSTIGAVDRQPGDNCAEPLNERSLAKPTSDYGRSKLEAEGLLRNSGLNYSIVRPAMVVGADMRSDSHFAVFCREALTRSPLSRIAWPGHFSVVHVDDLARALLLVSIHKEAQGETYFCAGESISICECFKQSQPNVKRIPLDFVLKLIGPIMAWFPFSLKAMLSGALVASDSKLRSLGWAPSHTARSALSEVITREAARIDPRVNPGGQTVITGAASGLGRALVDLLAPLRSDLLLVDCDGDGLAAIANRYPHCRTAIVDLSSESELTGLTQGAQWNKYPITELYACAGIGLKGYMQDISYTLHKKMFSVNVLARLFLAQNAVETMRNQHFGRVVIISSSSAFQPLPSMATYAATNSALLSLGEAWSHEVRKQGVHIMTVCPGGMQTNFQMNNGVKINKGEKLMPPTDVANQILIGLNSRKTVSIISLRSFAMSMLARILTRNMSLKLWGNLMGKLR
ncbi:MAG: SDR family NAD(P)-dependent oxidoreductase [Aquabacterium sp.]|nr:SDR family NAD(P)-dependent oxidoreductase [Aquabacterium sp.]